MYFTASQQWMCFYFYMRNLNITEAVIKQNCSEIEELDYLRILFSSSIYIRP